MAKEPKEHKGPGRPVGTGRQVDLVQVEALCSLAATDEDLAVQIGVHRATIDRWKNERPEFLEAMDRGKSNARMSIRRMLFEKAQSGNLGAMIWLSKQLCGYRENPLVDFNVQSTFADAVSSLLEHKG